MQRIPERSMLSFPSKNRVKHRNYRSIKSESRPSSSDTIYVKPLFLSYIVALRSIKDRIFYEYGKRKIERKKEKKKERKKERKKETIKKIMHTLKEKVLIVETSSWFELETLTFLVNC